MPESKKVIIGILLWRIFLFILIVFAPYFFTLQPNFLGASPFEITTHPLLNVHGNFDGEHYISIAKDGYHFPLQAFFPLYPKLLKTISPFVGNNFNLTGFIISNLSFLFAMIVLYKLIKLDNPTKIANLTLVLLLVFPTSFYFGAVYTESIFLLFVVLSFYAARKKYWLISGIVGFLATYTRFVGIFIFPALLVEWWLQNQNQKKNYLHLLAIFLTPLGLLSYMNFLNKNTGDPFAFFHTLSAYGEFRSEKIILLYQVFWRYLKMILTVDRATHLYWTISLELFTGIVFLVTSAISFRAQRLSFALFNFAAYIMPTLTGSFVSLPRYVLVCFTSFVVIAKFLDNRPKFRNMYIILNIIALIYFWMKFTRGYWVG